MPQRHEHLIRAQENEKLASALRPKFPVCADWAITILFYAALHYIDAFLAGKNLHPLNHDARDKQVEQNGSLTDIYDDYRRLKDLSRAARYEIACYPPEAVEMANGRLARIKEHLGI